MASDPYSKLDDDQRRFLSPYLTGSGPSAGNEWRGFCVEHEDPAKSGSPSASYNFSSNKWHCMSCGKGGSISRLLKRMAKEESEPSQSSNVISMKTGKAPAPLPSQKNIDNWHAVLLDDESRMAYLAGRGIDREAVELWEIGFSVNDSRFTIPVRDRDGNLVNVRRYRPDSPSKMLPWSDGVPTSLFNPAALATHDGVVLCEGEWDCILLNSLGIPAVTTTAGAEGFSPEWASAFRGKIVWLCLDADDGGARGTAKTAEILRDIASAVYAIELPFGEDHDQKDNDVTDFFTKGDIKDRIAEFREAMERSTSDPLWDANAEEPALPDSGTLVSLEESQRAETSQVVEMYVRVFGKQSPAYIAPRIFQAQCSQDKGPICKGCPMRKYDGKVQKEIRLNDPVFLRFLDATETQVHDILRGKVGARCKDRIEFSPVEEVNIEQLVVGQSIEHLGEEVGVPYSDTLYSIDSHRTPINAVARVVGQRKPDPKTQRGLLQVWSLEAMEEDIDSLALTEEDLEELAVFQPENGQSPLGKSLEIAHDLAENITHIYGRDKMHVAYDLAWHSALGFNFAGKPISKGWLDVMLIGDTRTGKSEAAARLREHYAAGDMTSCEGSTLAGLLGGAQQMNGKHWMVTWGIIPRNDRRLVVLDEFSGMKDKAIIDELSSVRSEGVARITKIASEETSARTRMIWISNPSDGKTLSETNGMVALRKLIANPEDIARFDYVMAVSGKDVPSSEINSLERDEVPHKYNAELCRKLVLWAWSRKSDQIRIGKTATEAIVAAAEDMGLRYLPDPPLVQAENIRMKLARLSVAFAARTFSTNATGELVIVRPEHVASSVEFLDMVYAEEAMGYRRHSQRMTARREAAVGYKSEVIRMLRRNPKVVTVLRMLQDVGRFKMRDMEDLGCQSAETGGGTETAHWLMERNMLSWLSGAFLGMEPALIEILAELEG